MRLASRLILLKQLLLLPVVEAVRGGFRRRDNAATVSSFIILQRSAARQQQQQQQQRSYFNNNHRCCRSPSHTVIGNQFYYHSSCYWTVLVTTAAAAIPINRRILFSSNDRTNIINNNNEPPPLKRTSCNSTSTTITTTDDSSTKMSTMQQSTIATINQQEGLTDTVAATTTSTTTTLQSPRTLWTVCNKCHGEGRMYQRSRKARQRFKRKGESHVDGALQTTTTTHQYSQRPVAAVMNVHNHNRTGGTTDNGSTGSITTTSCSVTICNGCSGSGLVQQPFLSNNTPSPMSFDTVPTTSSLPEGGRKRPDMKTNSIINQSIDDDKTMAMRQQQQQQQQPQQGRPIQIAVIGGGIGGLALATACQHRNIHVSVYERDSHFAQRKQGYGLTLQQASKQLMGLGIRPDELVSSLASSSSDTAVGITSTKHIVHDAQGNVKGTWGLRHWLGDSSINTSDDVLQVVESPTQQRMKNGTTGSDIDGSAANLSMSKQQHRRRQNIHIARQALRYELYKAATANDERATLSSQSDKTHSNQHSVVQWNHRFVKYDELDDHVELTFAVADSNKPPRMVKAYADIVIGADGIRSQVRQQFFGSNDTPLRYLDCIVILGICPLADLEKTDVRQSSSSSSYGHLLDGQTVFQTADGVTRMYMMPYSKTEYMWQLSFPMVEVDAIELSSRGSVALRDMAVSKCRTWHAPIPQILQSTPMDLVTGYPVYDRDVVQPQQLTQYHHSINNYSRRISFIGDSIHCMSPFKGQGANQALIDGLSLARYLYKAIRTARSKSGDRREGTTENINPVEQCCCELTGQDIEVALHNYEQEMLTRSAVKVKASADAAHFLHTNIAIQEGDVTRGCAAALAVTTNYNGIS